MTRPWFIGTTKGGEREPCRIVSTGEPLTEYLTLARSPGRFVLRHEQLAPNQRASSAHSHSKMEEFFFVLAGRLRVWIDGETHGLGPVTTSCSRPRRASLTSSSTTVTRSPSTSR